MTNPNPAINGKANTRYICGEVGTIIIIPPASGIVDVIFESGTTPAVLMVPDSVKWPKWFDGNLKANRTYEVNIASGKFGAVMSW